MILTITWKEERNIFVVSIETLPQDLPEATEVSHDKLRSELSVPGSRIETEISRIGMTSVNHSTTMVSRMYSSVMKIATNYYPDNIRPVILYSY